MKAIKRTSLPVAFSEYVSKNPDRSTQVWMARLEMIESTKQVFPDFLNSLLRNVFPLFCQLAKTGYDFDLILSAPRGSPYEALTNDCGLKQALFDWAQEFNADSGWLMDDAIRTLQGWYKYPDWRDSLRWMSLHCGSPYGTVGEPFTFSCAGWELEGTNWSDYRKFVHRCVDESLTKYGNEARALAQSNDLVKAQRKYSLANIKWFVLYQFAGRSSIKIADDWSQIDPKGIDESRVLKGIRATERLIGWDRPRKFKKRRNRKIPAL
jgi:hypothetical protein